ncbi:signal-transducing adaptor protein 1-like [Cyprinodon tularosa]|uniref:signal-transducing adaptor protein 1-like n=1 Tax=Cyprinodon tularosa TaxID=77115 RepID=UPI0018E1FD05|nr:signal-transducing adaptor protein 1-like [Cyprinodon tularosa]XP_038148505.1 signal-transducing adaptor protein 1-like [Cyprinodon tularosa]
MGPVKNLIKRRETITALPLYYAGNLLKKGSKEKDFKSFYGELRGSTLFLYNNDTQETYTERLDLELLKSLELESPYKKTTPTIITLSLPKEEVQLKMDNADTGEEWRGYILTVVNKEIPKNLQMLPGQKIRLEETLSEEKKRATKLDRPALPPRPSFMQAKSTSEPKTPACFFDVTRQEAEKMLDSNPENGNIILRPSTMPKNYALTLRQPTPRGPVFKNYRVTSTSSGYVIELDNPMTVSSLEDVLKYFLEKTEYRLRPYVASQPYDVRIDVSPPPKCMSIPPPVVPKAQVAPMLRGQTKDKLLPPTPKEEEELYVYPDDSPPVNQMSKKAQMNDELQSILKKRKENLYTETGRDDESTYKNETCDRNGRKIQWFK